MLYESDVRGLLQQWEARLNCPEADDAPEYRDALRDCIFDLNNLLSKSIEEELSYQDFLEMQADSYLSSEEAHEKAA